MSRTLMRIPVLVLAALALAGCTRGVDSTPGNAPNLEKWVADVKARPAPALDPLGPVHQMVLFMVAGAVVVLSIRPALNLLSRSVRSKCLYTCFWALQSRMPSMMLA